VRPPSEESGVFLSGGWVAHLLLAADPAREAFFLHVERIAARSDAAAPFDRAAQRHLRHFRVFQRLLSC